MQKPYRVLMSIAGIGLGILAVTSPAQADMKVGVLSCKVDPGWGLILGSSRELRCTYDPIQGPIEHYYGKVSKVGIDIGYTSGGTVIWDVVAPAEGIRPGALEGSYGGATASATLGVGVGVNALIGGFERSFTLQPVSFEGNKGLNVAAGIGAISLHHDRALG